MSNLLLSPLSRPELVSIFLRNPPRGSLPKFGDSRWSAVFSTAFALPFCEQLIERARGEADSPLPVLTDALYQDYSVTGTRLNFEKVYFERRRLFARAAIALLHEGSRPNPAVVESFLTKL
ncbi:MAG: heparinase, partial [Rariglobus sp.]